VILLGMLLFAGLQFLPIFGTLAPILFVMAGMSPYILFLLHLWRRNRGLIVHGAEDAAVKPAIVDQHKAGMPQAQVRIMSNAGHAPFWDDAAAFNQHLRAFCEALYIRLHPIGSAPNRWWTIS
jgi:pimeloyl-ACP methyl ester carboxylesterase